MSAKKQRHSISIHSSNQPVFFHDPMGENGWLSPMYVSKFKAWQKTYDCTEQFFQYCKVKCYGNKELRGPIFRDDDKPLVMKSPFTALFSSLFPAQASNESAVQVNTERPSDSKIRAYSMMLKGNWLKFSVSERAAELQALLLQTGNREIVAASSDSVWGCGVPLPKAKTFKNRQEGKRWPGENLLGKTLMDIRSRLIEEKRLSKEGDGPRCMMKVRGERMQMGDNRPKGAMEVRDMCEAGREGETEDGWVFV